MVKNCSHVHFVGIGGVSTSALAQWLVAHGKRVTGSDKTKSVFTDKLKSLGVQIDFPCGNDLLRGCDFVVSNSAISNDDSEIVLAKKLGKPVFNRSELLGVVFDSFAKNVAVCGMHGKTTTSAMIASCLEFANQKPTAFVGGICKNFNSNFLNGSGDFCVAHRSEAGRTDAVLPRKLPGERLHRRCRIVRTLEGNHRRRLHHSAAPHKSGRKRNPDPVRPRPCQKPRRLHNRTRTRRICCGKLHGNGSEQRNPVFRQHLRKETVIQPTVESGFNRSRMCLHCFSAGHTVYYSHQLNR